MNSTKYKHKNIQPRMQNINYKEYQEVTELK